MFIYELSGSGFQSSCSHLNFTLVFSVLFSCFNSFVIYCSFTVSISVTITFNPIQHGVFRGCSRMGGGAFWPALPKIRHTFPTMMKLSTIIPYLRKIQKMYKSRDTSLGFCWRQHFFNGNQQILRQQEIQR